MAWPVHFLFPNTIKRISTVERTLFMQSSRYEIIKMWRHRIIAFKAAKNHESDLRCFGKNQAPAGNPPTSQNTGRCQKDSAKNTYRILLAEDDSEMRALLEHSLRRAGFEVIACPDGWTLIKHLENYLLSAENHENVDIIISDIRMPGPSGIAVLRDLGRLKSFPPMILITAFGDDKTHALAFQLGAAAIFDKPFDIDELILRTCEILKIR